MSKKITGEQPMYPNPSNFGSGITIYQEAVLRFMVELSPKWMHPEDCAAQAIKYADAYIAALNSV